MHSPRCESITLIEFDRDGVTIDRCGTCRGIWLDRGELEKLIALAGPSRRVGRADEDRPTRRGRKRSWLAVLEFD